MTTQFLEIKEMNFSGQEVTNPALLLLVSSLVTLQISHLNFTGFVYKVYFLQFPQEPSVEEKSEKGAETKEEDMIHVIITLLFKVIDHF